MWWFSIVYCNCMIYNVSMCNRKLAAMLSKQQSSTVHWTMEHVVKYHGLWQHGATGTVGTSITYFIYKWSSLSHLFYSASIFRPVWDEHYLRQNVVTCACNNNKWTNTDSRQNTEHNTRSRSFHQHPRSISPRPWLVGKTVGGGGLAEGGDIIMEDMNLAQWSLGTRLVIMVYVFRTI